MNPDQPVTLSIPIMEYAKFTAMLATTVVLPLLLHAVSLAFARGRMVEKLDNIKEAIDKNDRRNHDDHQEVWKAVDAIRANLNNGIKTDVATNTAKIDSLCDRIERLEHVE